MVVVEAPDAVRAGGFKVVCALQFAQESDVAGEDQKCECWESGRGKDGEPVQTE